MSFLQRLNKKGVISKQSVVLMDEETNQHEITKLAVDVIKNKNSFIIFAQVAGADIHDVHIAIEGEDNIVIIEGQQKKPPSLVDSKNDASDVSFAGECTWGKFYRRIILPERVEIKKATAKIKDGILTIVLPLRATGNESQFS